MQLKRSDSAPAGARPSSLVHLYSWVEGGSQARRGLAQPHARAEASWPAPMKPTLMVRLRACRAAPRNAQLPSEGASGEGRELKDAACRVPRPGTEELPAASEREPSDPASLTDRARRALHGPAQTERPIRGLELGGDQSASRSSGGPKCRLGTQAACPPPAHGFGGGLRTRRTEAKVFAADSSLSPGAGLPSCPGLLGVRLRPRGGLADIAGLTGGRHRWARAVVRAAD